MTDQIAIEAKQLGKKYYMGVRHRAASLKEAIGGYLKLKNREANIGREFWALKNVSFTIKKGEVVGIIGENGAGKSTLLKILSGVALPTTGCVVIHGRVASLLEIGTGFNGELTGRENIFLNGVVLGLSLGLIKDKFNQIVDFADIGSFLDTPVKRYSSGMYMRLAFSVAAHLDSDILLLDEVFSVGDIAFQKKSLHKITEMIQQGKTVAFVSHNLSAVENYCTRAIWLDKGRVVMDELVSKTTKAYYDDKIVAPAKKAKLVPLAKRLDRTGNGNARLTDIRTPKDVSCTDKIKIDVRANFGGKDQTIVVLLAIISEQGMPVFWLDSRYGNLVIRPNTKSVSVVTDRLNVVPGNYGINAAIIVDGQVADQVNEAAAFTVKKVNFFGDNNLPEPQHGVYLLNQQWKL